MTGYLCEMKGEASFARRGWLAIIRAAGRVEEKSRLEAFDNYQSSLANATLNMDLSYTLWGRSPNCVGRLNSFSQLRELEALCCG